MTVAHSMSDFVFPGRPKVKSTITPDNSQHSSNTNQALPLAIHNSSSPFASNTALPLNQSYSTSPSESSFANINYMAQHLQSDLPSNHFSNSYSDSYFSQKDATYSTNSVHYKPITSTTTASETSLPFAEDKQFLQKQTLAQPFVPVQQLGNHDSKRRNSSIYTNESVEMPGMANVSIQDPFQESYRCLTTPSSLHPSPSINSSYKTQRQSSFSSPTKNIKPSQSQQFGSLFVPKFNRSSHPYPLNSSNTPSRDQPYPQERAPSPTPSCIPIETLIKLDLQYSSSTSNANNVSSRLVQLLIYHNIVNRLQASTHGFFLTLVERFKSDPAKFVSPYTQAIEFTSSILNNDFSTKNSNFMSSLKSSNRNFLISFLTIIKQKPSFICACLCAMNENDTLTFFSPSSTDPFDELSALHRSNALDIIFYSFFPPTAPNTQRFEYFSFIVSFLLNTNASSERYDRLCLAILEKITGLSSRNHLASLETTLLGILQGGQFLMKGPQNTYPVSGTPVLSHINLPSPSTPVSSAGSANFSTPNSSFSSPETAASNYNSSPSTTVTSPFSPNVICPSISLQRTTAKPTISSSMHNNAFKASSNSLHSVDTEFENKRLLFIDNSITQILSQINNSSTESIPGHMLHFSKLVLASVSESNHKRVLDFIFFKYFLGRYLYIFFSSPESLNMAKDFLISDRHRQRILLAIYSNLYHYAEVVLLNKPSNMSILPAIHNNIMLMYNKFSSLIDKSSSFPKSTFPSSFNDLSESVFSTDSQATGFGSLNDKNHHFDSRLCSQLLVLSPSDVLTLYSSLFPDYALQRQASLAQTTSNTRPISVERSSFVNSNYNLNRSSSSSYSYAHAGSVHSSSSGALDNGSNNFNESLPSLDEINMHFPDDCTSTRTTPFFGSEDSKFEWSLNDIRDDIEPVANELLKKFTYLQFRGPGASQYLSSMRPQKLQHFRLPHPLAERWQIFRIEKDGIVSLDETSIVGLLPVYDDLDGGPLKQSNLSDGLEFPMRSSHEESPFVEFEKSPISSGHKGYAEIVTAALEKLISDNSLFKTAGSTSSFFDNDSSGAFNFSFGNPFDIPYNLKSNDSFFGNNSLSNSSVSSPAYLLSILSDAGRRAIALSNYLEGNEYFSAVQALQKLFPSPSSTTYVTVANEINSYLVKCLKRDKENKLRNVAQRLKRCEQISQPYQHYLKLSVNSCETYVKRLQNLRVKVWYITEVRTSQVWSRARDVTISLNRGTDPVSLDGSELTTRSHTLKRNNSSTSLSSASAFSFKRFTSGSKRDYQNKRHSMSHIPTGSTDSMFAPVEYAGHNKLSDKEAEATKKWLDGQNIQIFCASEERIHRFSCEVDDLIKRVIGDASSTRRNRGQSLLTTSPLFKSDLCKLIDEIENMDRSSFIGASTLSKSQSYHFGINECANFEEENDLSNRRKSIDNLSIDANNNARSKQSTQDLSRSYSTRSHRSRKSSPNLIDMFSSLDMAGKRMSSTDLNVDLERLATSDFHGHRRNKSLNETSMGNISFGSEDNSAGPVYMDEADRLLQDEKREKLESFILELQMTVTSLIYTDLGLDGWSEGSETDKWLTAPIVRESIKRITERNRPKTPDNVGLRVNTTTESRSSWRKSNSNADSPNYGSLASHGKLVPPASLFKFHFPYEKAYSQLIYQLSVNPSPMGKLKALYELVRLVVSYLSSGSGSSQKRSNRSCRGHSNRPSLENQISTPGLSGVEKSMSRKGSLSAMTSLGEAIATVEAKRISSSAFTLQSPMLGSGGFSSVGPSGNRVSVGPNTDAIAEELQRIFKTTDLEVHTLFRDLQFIAAFVPSRVLDLTDMGKAFWDVSLAALSLKEEKLLVITQTASELFKRHTGMISADLSDDFLKKWSLKECAWMWSIASKEGDIEGQRELAMIHFSHPQIAPICVAPFSKLVDVFSNTLLDEFRITEDPDKLDPVRMSIIKHWMLIAASRGDSIAKEYLSQQDFI